MIRYDAMKCGMLIIVASHACAPAPMITRSDLPLSSSGTKTMSDRPPARRKSTSGEMIEPLPRVAAPSTLVIDALALALDDQHALVRRNRPADQLTFSCRPSHLGGGRMVEPS